MRIRLCSCTGMEGGVKFVGVEGELTKKASEMSVAVPHRQQNHYLTLAKQESDQIPTHVQ